MKRLLVTGATGFIGRHCVELAVKRGYEVWAVRSGTTKSSEFPGSDEVNWRTLDLLDPNALPAIIAESKATHVLHSAWVTDHGSYWTSPMNLDWLAFGARFFRLFAESGGKRFVSVGTCAEYDWSHGYMVEDITPETAQTFYGKIKLAHHSTLMATSKQFGFSAATGRIFFAYGPFENAARLIPYICRSLASDQEAKLGNAQLYRDFMYVSDVANGLMALIENDKSGPFNVSSGQPTRLLDIALTLGRIAHKPHLMKIENSVESDEQARMIVGSNKSLRLLGWKEEVGIEVGLEKAYRWWFDNRKKI